MSLTGPGGVGKTRLAVEAAWSVLSRFRGGAWFVDFAAVTDPEAIVDTIIGVVGVRDRDHLVEQLSQAPTLLVLDNLEHLLSGVVAVSDLLAACPKLVVLATTRERLRLQGEHEVVLDGLGARRRRRIVRRAPRWCAATSSLTSTSRQLCDRVDGLPLAIELAAGAVAHAFSRTTLSPHGHMLDTLSRGRARSPARHQAMRAAIPLSVDALTEAERSVFRGFAVFAGGANHDAHRGGVRTQGRRGRQSLVDKSLMRHDDERVHHARTDPPVRRRASPRLTSPASTHNGFRHTPQLLPPVRPTPRARPRDGPPSEVLAELAADHANLRLALDRGATTPAASGCLTRSVLDTAAYPHEGRAVLDARLARVIRMAINELCAPRRWLVRANLAVAADTTSTRRGPLLEEAIALGDASRRPRPTAFSAEAAPTRRRPRRTPNGYFRRRARDFAGQSATTGSWRWLVRNNQSSSPSTRGDLRSRASADGARKRLVARANSPATRQAAIRAVGNLGRRAAIAWATGVGGAEACSSGHSPWRVRRAIGGPQAHGSCANLAFAVSQKLAEQSPMGQFDS